MVVASAKPAEAGDPVGAETSENERLKEALARLLRGLPPAERRRALETSAQETARVIGADVVRDALRQSKKTLRQIQDETGLEPAMISRIATGHHQQGPHLWSLVAIARALDRDLVISIK